MDGPSAVTITEMLCITVLILTNRIWLMPWLGIAGAMVFAKARG